MIRPMSIAVSGATGRIGYALVFRIASGAMFGPNQPVALSLLDIPEAEPILEATTMELEDSAFPLLTAIRHGTEPAHAFAGADWIILIGSRPLAAVLSRSELLRTNGPILLDHGRAINEAAPSARVLVFANPCNTNCLIAQSVARDVPPEHWFAMMRLDQSRAQAMLAAKARVPIDHVTRVTAWGNHSDKVFADCHNAFIDERPAEDVIRDPAWVRNVFEAEVAGRRRKFFDKRRATPAGAAAQAIVATIRSITTPTPVQLRFSAAVLSDGSYGVPQGLVFGFPLRTEDGKTWSIVQNLYLDDHAQLRLAENVAELEYEASVVTDLLGNVR
jgi:malate dehydrogenase